MLQRGDDPKRTPVALVNFWLVMCFLNLALVGLEWFGLVVLEWFNWFGLVGLGWFGLEWFIGMVLV